MSAMPRPRGLLLTAWIMVFLNTAAWILQYWPDHHVYRQASTAVIVGLLMFTARVCGYACIFYYAQGRNWARILVLVTSVGVLLSSVAYKGSASSTPAEIIGACWVILSFFFLYWLNTGSVRGFFKWGAVTHAAS
jgi:hypothetical protein